jgi:hypothetical protein
MNVQKIQDDPFSLCGAQGMEDMATRHLLKVRDKTGLFTAIIRFLAGNAHVSFEGHLSMAPTLDFVVLPLEERTVRPILDALPQGKIFRGIIHVQVEKDGVLAFGAYNSFSPGCVATGAAVPVSLLEQLKKRGIIESFAEGKENKASGTT